MAAAVTPGTSGSAWDRLARALGDLDQEAAPGASSEGLGAERPGAEGSGADDCDGAGPGDGAGGRLLADQLVGLLQAWQQSLRAHAGSECRVCPVCQLVSLLRQTRPDVLEHLVGAAGELAAAVRLVVGQGQVQESHPHGHGTSGRGGVPVERIDVTD